MQIVCQMLSFIIENRLWNMEHKITIEYIVQQLISSEYLSDDECIHLLNIGSIDHEECSDFNGLDINTNEFISKINNVYKVINNSLECALNSKDMNSNGTHAFANLISNEKMIQLLQYSQILKLCVKVIGNGNSDSSTNEISNHEYISQLLMDTLVRKLLMVNADDISGNEQNIHQFLDFLNGRKISQFLFNTILQFMLFGNICIVHHQPF